MELPKDSVLKLRHSEDITIAGGTDETALVWMIQAPFHAIPGGKTYQWRSGSATCVLKYEKTTFDRVLPQGTEFVVNKAKKCGIGMCYDVSSEAAPFLTNLLCGDLNEPYSGRDQDNFPLQVLAASTPINALACLFKVFVPAPEGSPKPKNPATCEYRPPFRLLIYEVYTSDYLHRITHYGLLNDAHLLVKPMTSPKNSSDEEDTESPRRE